VSPSSEAPAAATPAWDFYGETWDQPPADLSPTASDPNPWCPEEFTQDGFTYFPKDAPHSEQLCRQVCLPPKYEKIASNPKHGLLLGSTCYAQGCREYDSGKKNVGVKVFQFRCPADHERPPLEARPPIGRRRRLADGASAMENAAEERRAHAWRPESRGRG
jgi:hypothetical protein